MKEFFKYFLPFLSFFNMANNAIYLIIDTETTGLNTCSNGLIEFACMALDAKLDIVASLQTDVCPPEGVDMDEESLKINGFTRERIQQGISYEELCTKFSIFLEEHFCEKPIIIAQFYPFDFSVISNVFYATNKNFCFARSL